MLHVVTRLYLHVATDTKTQFYTKLTENMSSCDKT